MNGGPCQSIADFVRKQERQAMWFNRILVAGVLTLGVAIAGWAQQPPNQNPTTAQPRTSAQPPALTTTNNLNANTVVDGSMNVSVFLRATQVVGIEVRESTGQARIGQV